jgi:DNA segregation ATPase FtsK/SpoIIIE-like protein
MKESRDERLTKLLINKIQETELYLQNKIDEVGALRDEIEFPLIVEDVRLALKTTDPKKINTAWLQERYNIGFARASRLMDELRKKKLVK